MQIIIIQTEIEEAIRNHILGQINVKDGQRIDIDLRATRGSDGFQAVIDIVPDSAPVRAQPVVEVDASENIPVVTPAKPVAATKPAKTVKATAPAAVKAAVQAASTEDDSPLPDAPVEQEPDMSAEADAGEQPIAEEAALEDGDQSVADLAAEPVPAKKPSLFANMKKPENA